MGESQSRGGKERNANVSNLTTPRVTTFNEEFLAALRAESTENTEKQTDHERDMNVVDAREYIKRVTGMNDDDTEATRQAIQDWSVTGYYGVRSYQQGNSSDKEFKSMGETLERYIRKAPKWDGKMTYRGINITAEQAASIKVGDTLNMRGTSSWSTDFSVAKDFADSKVVFASKTQRLGTSIKFHSQMPFEKEVLVSKRSSYTVAKVSKMRNGVTLVWLNEN